MVLLKRRDAATSCIILDQPIKYNLQVLALKKHTTLSRLINAAAEEYLRREEKGGVNI
jgi:hypothetical protein